MEVPVSTFQTQPIGELTWMPFEITRGKQDAAHFGRHLELSEISQAVLWQGWSEVHFSAQSSRFAYRRDGSLALAVHTSTSFSARRQEFSVEVHLPASVLGEGVTLKAPLVIESHAWDEHLHLRTVRQATRIRPTRRVEEILSDILKAVQEAFQGKEAKSLRLVFDEEAIRILSTDEKLRKLVEELLSLIQIIQALRQKETRGETQIVYISGKGKPYWQVNEEQTVEIEETRVSLRFVFQPSESA